MKKMIVAAFAALVALLAVGCGSTKGTLYGADQNEKNGLPRWARQGVSFFTDEASSYGAIVLSEKGLYAAGRSENLGNAKITNQAANLSARTELAGYIAQSIADLQHYEAGTNAETQFKQKTQANIANVLTGVRIVDGFENEKNGDYFSLAFISEKNLQESVKKIDDEDLRSMASALLVQWNMEANGN